MLRSGSKQEWRDWRGWEGCAEVRRSKGYKIARFWSVNEVLNEVGAEFSRISLSLSVE